MPLIEELPSAGAGGADAGRQQAAGAMGGSSFDFSRGIKGAGGMNGDGSGGGGGGSGGGVDMSRGDGRFADGSNVKMQRSDRGNIVRLSPAAFDEGNREETVRELERIGAIPKQCGGGKAGEAQAEQHRRAEERRLLDGLKAEAAAAPQAFMDDEMANGLSRLFNESFQAAQAYAGAASSSTVAAAGEEGASGSGLLSELDREGDVSADAAAAASAFRLGGGGGKGLPRPKHFMREITNKSGAACVECSLELPGVSSAAEAAAELHVAPQLIELAVPGRFEARVRLPKRVRDAEAKAKWKKATSTLVVTAPLE